jgi:hypothetical protein
MTFDQDTLRLPHLNGLQSWFEWDILFLLCLNDNPLSLKRNLSPQDFHVKITLNPDFIITDTKHAFKNIQCIINITHMNQNFNFPFLFFSNNPNANNNYNL